MTYDMDTSPVKRRQSPKLWGMIPDEGRGVVFVVMVMLSTFQMISKVFSTALLAATNSLLLVLWIMIDMAAYLIYKICKKDLTYFVPLEGAVKHFAAFFTRIVVKILVDYTGLMMFRNPYGKTVLQIGLYLRRIIAIVYKFAIM